MSLPAENESGRKQKKPPVSPTDGHHRGRGYVIQSLLKTPDNIPPLQSVNATISVNACQKIHCQV
nr:hypothetical protein [Escherichia albertii]